jgi:hypothetical protein
MIDPELKENIMAEKALGYCDKLLVSNNLPLHTYEQFRGLLRKQKEPVFTFGHEKGFISINTY